MNKNNNINITKYEPFEIKGNLKLIIILLLLGIIIFHEEMDILYNIYMYRFLELLIIINFIILKNNIGILFLLSVIYFLVTIRRNKN
jgi:hypothetical protein